MEAAHTYAYILNLDIFYSVLVIYFTYTEAKTDFYPRNYLEDKPEGTPGSIYIAIDDYIPKDAKGLPVASGQKVTILRSSPEEKGETLDFSEDLQLLDNSAAKHKISVRPPKHHPRRSREPEAPQSQERWLVRDPDTGLEGFVPKNLLGRAPSREMLAISIKQSMQDMSEEETLELKRKVTQEMKEIKSYKRSKPLGPSPEAEANAKRKATINELMETEEEYLKDLLYVMENYYNHLDSAQVPRNIADRKEAIFKNFNSITEFHQNVLIEGLKLNAEVPKMIGKTFLRLEREFDMHAEYCTHEPLAQELLANDEDLHKYFEKHSKKIGDEKRLAEHLKLPIQRLNDYQLLLKELIKYSTRLDDNTNELERAQELMQTIPQRATDAKFISSIEGYKGNLFKLGRLIRHDWFTVSEAGKKPKDRYLFLFKARILITKVKRISEDRSIFVLQEIIRLPETSVVFSEGNKTLEFIHIEPLRHCNFPIVIEARNLEIKEAWLKGVEEHVVDTASVEDLLFDDELKVLSQEDDEEEFTKEEVETEKIDELPVEEDQVVPETIVAAEVQEVKEPEVPDVDTKETSRKRSQEEDFWAEREVSPPPKRRASENISKTGSTEVVEVEPTKKRSKEEEADFWGDRESSPPSKRRQPPESKEETDEDIDFDFDSHDLPLEKKIELRARRIKRLLDKEQSDKSTKKRKKKLHKKRLAIISELSEEDKELIIDCKISSPENSSSVSNTESGISRQEAVDSGSPEQEEVEDFWSDRKDSEEQPKPSVKSQISEDPDKAFEAEFSDIWADRNSPVDTETVEWIGTVENEKYNYEKLGEDRTRERISPEAERFDAEESTEDSSKVDDAKLTTEITRLLIEKRKISAQKETEEKTVGKLQLDEADKAAEEETASRKRKSTADKKQESADDFEGTKKSKTDKTIEQRKSPSPPPPKEQTPPPKEPTPPPKEPTPPPKEPTPPPKEPTPPPKEPTPPPKEPTPLPKEPTPPPKEPTPPPKEPTPPPKEPTPPPKEVVKTKKSSKKSKSEESGSIMASQPPTPGSGPKPVFTKTITGDVVERKFGGDEYGVPLSKVDTGDGATFVCEISHPSAYYVTWLKDNKALDDKLADRVQQKEENHKHTLRLMNCRIEDSGIYTAKATDPEGGSSTCSAQLLVHEFTTEERAARLAERCPFFLVKLMPTEVIENTNLSYTIHVKGDPMPSVSFFKDDVLLKEDDRVKIHRDEAHGHYELLITHVQKGDAGQYKCEAENKYGIVDCQAHMSVAEEECVLQKLSGKGSLVQPGEKADFTWFRDGVEFDPVERFNVMFKDEEDTLALIFQNVTPDDAGIYTCVASTSCGKISCSAELTVEGAINRLMKDPEPPAFQEALEDSNATLSGTAMLECKITGFPKPELAWSKDGDNLKMGGRVKMLWEDEVSATLVIKNIKEEDKGSYKVIAKNELGEAESSCKLTIRSAPKFRKMEKFVACNLGQDLTYTIEVEGEPLPDIKWMKDGKEIQASDRISFEKKDDGSFTLKIKAMVNGDCGAYTIVATNEMGQRTENFEIDSEIAPEITRGLDTETEKKMKNDHTFEVRAKGHPDPKAKWFFNGKEIEESEHYKISKDNLFYMLTVKNITRSDQGMFKIVLTNNKGSAESEGLLTVRGPPEITSELENRDAKEGTKDIKFSVSFEANPKPNLKWYIDSKIIHDDTPGYRIENSDCGSVLIIQEATPDVVGNYKVEASNEYGDVSSSARFRLHEAPQILQGLKDVEFLEGESSKYVIKVSGVPEPDISWSKDGKNWSGDNVRVHTKTEGEDTFLLVIDEAKTEDSAHYTAKISNVEGEVTTEGTIIVNTPPHILGSNYRDGITFVAMHKFVLEVEVTAVPDAEATWYLNGKELKEEEGIISITREGNFYRLERIISDPEESGEYKCQLKNKIATVEEKGQVTIVEKESRVRMSLKDVEIQQFTDCTLECQIVGDPIPSVQWFQNGELIEESDKFEIREDNEKRMRYLTIKSIEEGDTNTYSVKGTNEHGDCETSCTVKVFVVPELGEFQDTVVDWGHELRLDINIHAIPIAEVTWFQDGKELIESDRISIKIDETTKTYSLIVKNVVLEDAGQYKVCAENVVGKVDKECEVQIHSAIPKIIEPLEDVEVCLEDDITFQIRCSGLPAPEVEWKNKGIVVNTAFEYYVTNPKPEVYCMMLRDVRMEDYGEISATGINLIGKDTTTCKLVQKKLECEILEGLPNVTKASEGENVTLRIKVRASPRPQFSWFKDGTELEESAKFIMKMEKTTYCEAYLSLTITQAYDDSMGQYKIKFSNELNELSSETALIISPERKPPVITSKPDDMTVTEMDGCLLKCRVNGFPKPDVKWYKDGREVRQTELMNMCVTADGEYYLEFKHITKEDEGRYTIVATNEEGVDETECYITVEPASGRPEFLQKLRATKVITGYPCRMEVKVEGHPMPEVAWLKNGKPVEFDGSHMKELVTDDGSVILQINKASDDDIGSYTAILANEFGQKESTADLAVLGLERVDGQPDGPSEFTEGLKDCCFDEGKSILLPIGVLGADVPNLKWYKDGEEIKLGDGVFFTYDGDKAYLEIKPCKGSDSGKYKCVIENPHGNAETECDVTVRKCFEKPSFIQTYPSQEQCIGGDVKFAVKVDGVPKPELAWYMNDEPIDIDGKKFRVRKEPDGCALYMRNASYDDSGSYTVVATNPEGEIEHKAHLRVGDDVDSNRKYEPPSFLKVIGDQELYEDYTAKFTAIVRGRPTPDFDWFRNGVQLFPNKRMIIERDLEGVIRLTIRHVTEDDMGVYELKVWNDYGEASCKGKLICESISQDKRRPVGDEYDGAEGLRQGIPVPLPETPTICALSDRRVTLSWVPYLPSSRMPPVTYQVEMCEVPEGDWITAATGIRGNYVDIDSLNPKSDYRFRVRVENRYGVSEPSPYVATHRNRLERHPISYEPQLDGVYDGPKDGPYVPTGFTLDRDSRGNFSAAPRFMKLPSDTQYGMKEFNTRLKWVVFGYPTPKLKFFFKDQELSFEKGSPYKFTYEPSGEACLYLNKIKESDVGWYKCFAYNEYGESQQRIRLAISEYPRVIEHLKETHIRAHGSGKLLCRISGVPPCNVKWFKDWQEIEPSIKYKPIFIEPDIYCLNIQGPTLKDTGLYSIAAVNAAGSVSSSGMVHIEDGDFNFSWTGPGRGKHVGINTRKGDIRDYYDLGDELGRGTQGVTYHCVEHHSGRNLAAKCMYGNDNLKVWMKMEYEMMNLSNSSPHITRLFDAFEGAKSMDLIMELNAGGELLDGLTKKDYTTEYEIAIYIRQVLEGLEYMHDRCIAHLGLNIGDIMLSRPNGLDIRLSDLSLARHIKMNKLLPLEYGMPEFVSPEIANKENVSYPADMWAVGVITYLLLSGTSPFRGEHDRETLTRVMKGELIFDMEAFGHVSSEAKDFIAKLLQFKPENRMDVKNALRHPWIRFADMSPRDPYKINTDRLRSYYSLYKAWYRNASCRNWFRRRPLEGAFTHPSKMVYPPYEVYTPEPTPERVIKESYPEDYEVPHKDFSYEVGPVSSESHYQCGPDTYLLQLRDSGFPARLRQYMNVAKDRSPSFAYALRSHNYDYERIPIVHERRRFTDIMDEEIEDERKKTIVDKYTSKFQKSQKETCSLDMPKRVKQEVSTRYTYREQIRTMKQQKEGGTVPFIREKPETTAITEGMELSLSCLATGEPEPLIQWHRNDAIIGETSRIKITTSEGKSHLTIKDCKEVDLGMYKVVARNGLGQVEHKFRIIRAEIPGVCEPPELVQASGYHMLLKWRPPVDDGGAPILCYHLKVRGKGQNEWEDVADNIEQELYLCELLCPKQPYQFKVAARNFKGWGEFSMGSSVMKALSRDEPTIPMPIDQELQKNAPKGQVLQQPGSRGETKDVLDYNREKQPVPMKTGETADLQIRKYKMIQEVHRGRFSTVMRALRQDDQRTFACKIFDRKNREEEIKREYEMMSSLRHEKLAILYEVYSLPDVTIFMMEYLSGYTVLDYLASKLEYTEQAVANLINQVLNAIEYLHWRGLCHLDLQPDNIVMTSTKKAEIKLIDFGSTQKVDSNGSTIKPCGLLDFMAPEIVDKQTAYPNSDVWSVGVLTYILLAGTTPFTGVEEEDTKSNIQFVRFKFDELGTKASQEATRFIMLIFKRDQSKRPSVEDCREHKWLQESEYLCKKRERAVISSGRLREFTIDYKRMKTEEAANTTDIFKPYTSQC